MKRIIKFCLSLSVCFLMLSVLLFSVSASNVTYDGNADDFIFDTSSKYSPSDLFENFQNCMPGDVLEQEIVVKNTISDGSKVEIFLRSKGADQQSTDLLSQLKLTVENKKDGSVIFDAPANQTAQLTEWKSLGLFEPNTESVLKVKLQIPIELGNEYQNPGNDIKKLTWQFKAEEKPVETTIAPTTVAPAPITTVAPSQPTETPTEINDNPTVNTGTVALSAVVVCVVIASALILAMTFKRKKN